VWPLPLFLVTSKVLGTHHALCICVDLGVCGRGAQKTPVSQPEVWDNVMDPNKRAAQQAHGRESRRKRGADAGSP
jgi:hypothetical protein